MIEIPERLAATHAELRFIYGEEFADRVIKIIEMVSAIKPGPVPPGRTWARRDAVTIVGETENRIRIWGEPHGFASRPFITVRVDDIRVLSLADLAARVSAALDGTHWRAEDVAG